MIRSITKRIINIFVTLLLVSIITFFMMKGASDDILLSQLQSEEAGEEANIQIQKTRLNYKLLQERYGMNKSLFYFSIKPRVIPSNLYSVGPHYRQDFITQTCLKHGDKKAALELNKSLNNFVFNVENNKSDEGITNEQLSKIERTESLRDLKFQLNNTKGLPQDLVHDVNQLLKKIINIETQKVSMLDLFPSIYWNGLNNQYHNYLISIITLDFGRSFNDSRLIKSKISSAISWTLTLSVISIFFIFLLSIPLGVYMAIKEGTRIEKILTAFLFFWKIVPLFWVATLFVIFLTSDYYGTWLNLFEGPGLGNLSQSIPFTQKVKLAFPHLVLPLILLILPNLAYITHQMKVAFLSESSKEYVFAAKAQGLSTKTIVWKYIFPNSLFPILTIMGNILPALISGSLIIEIIFNIPGMGRLAFNAIQFSDWKLLNVVIMMSAILTILGLVLSDILYYILDPRIRKKASL